MSINQQVTYALQRAYFYLKFRLRTEFEMRQYLKKQAVTYGWSDEVVTKAIEYLKEQEFINDTKFIIWIVESRAASKPKSVFALKNELMKFGVSKDLITEYFSSYEQDETELASKALEGRWRRMQSYDEKTRFQKAATFLSRRGFSFEIIKKTIQMFEQNSTVE